MMTYLLFVLAAVCVLVILWAYPLEEAGDE